jgi:hypothetical protein
MSDDSNLTVINLNTLKNEYIHNYDNTTVLTVIINKIKNNRGEKAMLTYLTLLNEPESETTGSKKYSNAKTRCILNTFFKLCQYFEYIESLTTEFTVDNFKFLLELFIIHNSYTENSELLDDRNLRLYIDVENVAGVVDLNNLFYLCNDNYRLWNYLFKCIKFDNTENIDNKIRESLKNLLKQSLITEENRKKLLQYIIKDNTIINYEGCDFFVPFKLLTLNAGVVTATATGGGGPPKAPPPLSKKMIDNAIAAGEVTKAAAAEKAAAAGEAGAVAGEAGAAAGEAGAAGAAEAEAAAAAEHVKAEAAAEHVKAEAAAAAAAEQVKAEAAAAAAAEQVKAEAAAAAAAGAGTADEEANDIYAKYYTAYLAYMCYQHCKTRAYDEYCPIIEQSHINDMIGFYIIADKSHKGLLWETQYTHVPVPETNIKSLVNANPKVLLRHDSPTEIILGTGITIDVKLCKLLYENGLSHYLFKLNDLGQGTLKNSSDEVIKNTIVKLNMNKLEKYYYSKSIKAFNTVEYIE